MDQRYPWLLANYWNCCWRPDIHGRPYGYRIPGIPKKSVHEILLRKCWDFWDSIFRSRQHEINFYRYSPTPAVAVLKMLWKCWDSTLVPTQSYDRINPYRFQRPATGVPLLQKTYGTTKRISSSTAVVGTLDEKRKLRRFILITAVKSYSKMKTPTQKRIFRVWLIIIIIKIPVGQSHGNPIPSCF